MEDGENRDNENQSGVFVNQDQLYPKLFDNGVLHLLIEDNDWPHEHVQTQDLVPDNNPVKFDVVDTVIPENIPSFVPENIPSSVGGGGGLETTVMLDLKTLTPADNNPVNVPNLGDNTRRIMMSLIRDYRKVIDGLNSLLKTLTLDQDDTIASLSDDSVFVADSQPADLVQPTSFAGAFDNGGAAMRRGAFSDDNANSRAGNSAGEVPIVDDKVLLAEIEKLGNLLNEVEKSMHAFVGRHGQLSSKVDNAVVSTFFAA
ncbi:hypothetical protein ABFS82_03G055500 [Erythranthe guttata]|uniref:uncharacterized protein LOC105966597 n=1 Tax=Erythranthe guttata TaxID=4155 RepID=UPI00064DB93D|nr:PREDICTED: uncharacterized protein LOC105966597 [Erythranthe guttata]|eukprot:XP_012846632.1 PREDICTED: uncharacterized protein LOC105966597 [Erythranthe guttata]